MPMYRYITLMWSRTDCDAAQAAKVIAAKLSEISPHEWSKAWGCAGLAIYHSGEHKGRMEAYRLQGKRGAILGRLFRNDYTSVTEGLDEFESRKCLESGGQHLVDNYWGRYVAFFNNPETGTRYVMRDPSGAFPCFHTPFRGVTTYFSDMQDAANFHFLPFTVNWEYLKANIMLPQFQKIITGLNEVSEVLPAECAEITPFEKKSRFVWNPTLISQTDVVEDPENAAELLRHTVKSTIGALAGCYDRVLHNLGGLDSSIVLACMAQATKRPEIAAVNFYTKSPRGEERYYSRQVAKMYGVELVERELDYRKATLPNIFHSNKLASSLGFFDCIGFTGDVLALANEKEAQALTYGMGGDNVFYQPPRNFGALDYVRKHGLNRNSLRYAMDASRYGRKSLTSTLGDMLRECVSPAPCYEYVYNATFERIKRPLINTEFVGARGHHQYLHPLLVPNSYDLKGKYQHIIICALFSIEYYDHFDTNYCLERLSVFLTQPIVSACLRIPTWTLTYGGVERGLARKAFKNDLPRDVVRRYSKSTPSEYYWDIYKHNTDYLREILLDGILVQEKVLLRNRVEKALKNSDLFMHVGPSDVLGYLAMEAWLRGWIERSVP